MPAGSRGIRKEALGEALDIHSVFAWTKYLNHGIDAHFEARTSRPSRAAKVSEFWTVTDLTTNAGKITAPAALTGLAIYSKNVFTVASFKTKLPVLTGSQRYYMGFEDDGAVGTGIACFTVTPTAPDYIANRLRVQAGGHFSLITQTIIWALPADSVAVEHVYSVHLLGPWSEFYIDDSLVAVAINSPNLNFTAIDGPPYALFRANAPYSRPQLALIEITAALNELTLPLSPLNTRLSNIPELPPRLFRLYSTGTTTLLAGLAVNPDVTSHPVPTFGYSSKTLLFRAGGAGTLSIQVLTQANNWREYDSVPVAANTLTSYIMEGDAVLARIVFTPTTPPATISDAEVIMI